ncbi:MAG: hypothetical protein AAGI91_13910 [Bacteroidota bacterium]
MIVCQDGPLREALGRAFERAGATLAPEAETADVLVVAVDGLAQAAAAVCQTALPAGGCCIVVCQGSGAEETHASSVTRLCAAARWRQPDARVVGVVACGTMGADPAPAPGGGLAVDVRRWPSPLDVAALCVLLASDAGASVDGEVIHLRDRQALADWLGPADRAD